MQKHRPIIFSLTMFSQNLRNQTIILILCYLKLGRTRFANLLLPITYFCFSDLFPFNTGPLIFIPLNSSINWIWWYLRELSTIEISQPKNYIWLKGSFAVMFPIYCGRYWLINLRIILWPPPIHPHLWRREKFWNFKSKNFPLCEWTSSLSKIKKILIIQIFS